MKFFSSTSVIPFIGIILLSSSDMSNAIEREDPVEKGSARIVGGDTAYLGQFPYMVFFTGYDDEEIYCSGSIYNETTVITAASCDIGITYTVYAGRNRVSTPTPHEQITEVLEHLEHPGWNFYDGVQSGDDIVIVTVSPPFVFDEYVNPITLPAQDEETREKTSATVSGWGRLIYEGAYPDFLQYVEVEVISDSTCQESYTYDPIYDTFLCAEGEQKGFCQGDRGAPLVEGYNGNVSYAGYKQIGIASWFVPYVDQCTFYPQIYTQVSKYVNWIMNG